VAVATVAAVNVVVERVMVGALTVRVYVWLPVKGPEPVLESVAVTVKLNEPAAVAVPESVPSEARLRPAGREPAVTAKV